MGLSLRLGCADGDVFIDADVLTRLNDHLESDGLPRHAEPTDVDTATTQAECRMAEYQGYPSIAFPYSFIHLLRRIYVRIKLDLTPLGEPVQNADDDADVWEREKHTWAARPRWRACR